MGIELDVSTWKNECYPGDVIEGAVKLTVSAVSSCLSYYVVDVAHYPQLRR